MEKEENNIENTDDNHYIKIKKFKFIMMIFLLIFFTAGITLVALSFGEEKAADVAIQERSEFNKLYRAYDELNKKYFEDINKDEMIDGAIDGMVKALGDPYSDYMTKEENDQFKESISASFEGIGAEIQEVEGNIIVVSPIKGSPAEKAGIQPNDKIIEVDDQLIQGMTANEAVLLIRGEKGTKVNLRILRGDSNTPIDVTITRDEIPLNTVYAEMLDDSIAKIQITSFSDHTDTDFVEALEEMEKQGMKSLILDVRRNPGGLLDQAVTISNMFIPDGKNILQVEYRDQSIEKYVAKAGEKLNIPTVILIDEGSASASEILAAAASESANIPLVGVKSFGKGTVQTAKDFKDGSNVKYTMAKWLTPEGNWVHEKGIKPDYEVSLPDYANLPYINPDEQLKLDVVSDVVKAAEEMLKVLGFNPGKVDGLFDEETEKAVKELQSLEDMETTGVLTGESTIVLMKKFSEHLMTEDPQVLKAIDLLKPKSDAKKDS